MPLFDYKARSEFGELITGREEARSEESLRNMLGSKGLIPISVVNKGMVWNADLSLKRHQFTPRALILFTRQFQAMFKVGVPVDAIMETLARQSENERFKKTLETIRDDISAGSRLSVAFGKHPNYFTDLYVSMIAVGEEGGVLEKTLLDLVKVLNRELQTHQQIKTAILYPKIVVGVLVLVILAMLVFVIPEFENFYASHGATLPLPTRILLGASNFVQSFWWGLLIFFGVGWMAWNRFRQTARGELLVDKLAITLPVLGSLNQLIVYSRFGHLLSALYRSGLQISRALEILKGVLDNRIYANQIDEVINGIESGRTIADSMRDSSLFPPMLVESVNVGERSGTIDEMVEGIATLFDEEIEERIKTISTFIEPLLLLGIFGIVALTALAIYLPIWNLTRVISPGG